MVTGDNVETAKAIALECGILDTKDAASEPIVIEGKVFRDMSEVAREEIVEKITVMGRSSPNDKLLLVQSLKRKGHVVAVTGAPMMLLHCMRPVCNFVISLRASTYSNFLLILIFFVI